MKQLLLRGSVLFFTLCCALTWLILPAESAFAASTATTGMVRFIHAASGIAAAPAATTQGTAQTPANNGTAITPGMVPTVGIVPGSIDIFVDGQALAPNLAFATATNYVSVATGTHMVQVAPAGQGAAAALGQQQITVTAGMPQTVAILGGTANAPLMIKAFADNNALVSGQAQIRAYQLSGLGTVNINVNGAPTVQQLQQGMASLYHTVTPGTNVPVQLVTQTQPMQTMQATMNLPANTVTSIFLVTLPQGMATGPQNGTTAPSATATPATTGTTNAQMTTIATGNTAMPVMMTATTMVGMPGMPQTGSDPTTSNGPLPWLATVALILAASTGLGIARLRR